MPSSIHIETAFKAMVLLAALGFVTTEFFLVGSLFSGSMSLASFLRYTFSCGATYLVSPFIATAAIWFGRI